VDNKKEIDVFRVDAGVGGWVKDHVASEETLALYVDGRELVTLLYTPPMAIELAMGYLLSEGLIASKDDVDSLSLRKGGVLVGLKPGLPKAETPAARVLTSGCGGGITFTYPQGVSQIKKLSTKVKFSADAILNVAAAFRKLSPLFEETGGVHSAALSDGTGFLAFAEDIGRHNAVDKIFGKCLLDGVDVRDKLLYTTGRVSSEILLKAAKRGVPVIVSRGAPTALSLVLAEKLKVTVTGFVRGRRMNVYTHPERVTV